MQILIEIPEEEYLTIRQYQDIAPNKTHSLAMSIINGKQLPKGHGDLIDRDDLLADSYVIDDWSGNEVNIVDVMSVKMADTIIEADKERE